MRWRRGCYATAAGRAWLEAVSNGVDGEGRGSPVLLCCATARVLFENLGVVGLEPQPCSSMLGSLYAQLIFTSCRKATCLLQIPKYAL